MDVPVGRGGALVRDRGVVLNGLVVTTSATTAMMATTATTMPQPMSSLLRLSFFSCASRISRAFSRACGRALCLGLAGFVCGAHWFLVSYRTGAGPLSGNSTILGEKPGACAFKFRFSLTNGRIARKIPAR